MRFLPSRIIATLFAIFLSTTFAGADEFPAVITKVNGNQITLAKYNRGAKGELATLTAAGDCKVVSQSFDKQAKTLKFSPLDNGLKSDRFRDSARAMVLTNNGKVTEIRLPDPVRGDGILGIIKFVDGDKLIVFKIDSIRTVKGPGGRAKTEMKGTEKQFTIAPHVMVVQVRVDKETEQKKIFPLDAGLASPVFADDKLNCRLLLDDEGKVYEIRIAGKDSDQPGKSADPAKPSAEGGDNPVDKKALNDLQGLWIFEKSSVNSTRTDFRTRFEDSLYIENSKIFWVNKQGMIGQPHFKGIVSVNATKSPLEMTLTHVKNEGLGQDPDLDLIYKIDGRKLVIALRREDDGARPRQFTTALTAGRERATHVFFYEKKTKDDAGQVKDPPVAKLTEEQRKELEQKVLKDLQGYWILDKTTVNWGRSNINYRSYFDEAIYVEKDKLHWARKNGTLGIPHWEAVLGIDPSKSPMEMDITRIRNKLQGEDRDIKAIFKIEGKKLLIALRRDESTRPRQFTSALTAGPERATHVYFFERKSNADE